MIAVARNSLDPIWSWLCQDLIPTDARSFVFQAKGAVAYAAPPRALVRICDRCSGTCRSICSRRRAA